MNETLIHPSPALLRQLSTLRELPADDLKALSERLSVHSAAKGAELLALGSNESGTLYLIEGSCRLTAEDGGVKVIQHTDTSALAPLARLRPSRYRVTAETDARYLLIDHDLVDEASGVDSISTLSLGNYQVDEEVDLGHMGAENRLTLLIYEDLNNDRLLLPSLPHVAVRIGDAVNDDRSDARKIANLIESDPAIALKILKAANSARYGGVSHVATVAEAVTRLGLQTTRLLVITFAMRELFRTTSKALEKRMMVLWEHSRRIAALARVLSEKVGGFNSHEALLAGLVHDIGVVAVIAYAREVPEVADNPIALESSIRVLRTQLSGMILAKWDLPAEVVAAAKEAEHWYRSGGEKGDYADLVIVAQLHEGVGGDIDPAKVPALQRLGLAPDDIDRGIELLHNAHEEIAAAKQLLNG